MTVGAGSNQGAALAMIGTSDNQLNDAYEWNGSNWSEISEIGTNRGRNQGGGESTEAAIVFGGDDTPTCIKTNQTERTCTAKQIQRQKQKITTTNCNAK